MHGSHGGCCTTDGSCCSGGSCGNSSCCGGGHHNFYEKMTNNFMKACSTTNCANDHWKDLMTELYKLHFTLMECASKLNSDFAQKFDHTKDHSEHCHAAGECCKEWHSSCCDCCKQAIEKDP